MVFCAEMVIHFPQPVLFTNTTYFMKALLAHFYANNNEFSLWVLEYFTW